MTTDTRDAIIGCCIMAAFLLLRLIWEMYGHPRTWLRRHHWGRR